VILEEDGWPRGSSSDDASFSEAPEAP